MSESDPTSNSNPLQVIHLKNGTTTTVDKVYHYFAGLFAAEKSGKDFPVNLDHIWKLAYTRRDECVRALVRSNFLENVDYVISRNDAGNSGRGRPSETYMLSVQVAEHLIARKVSEIFEIYRQCRVEVTTRARHVAEEPKASNLMLAKLMLAQLEEQERKLSDHETRLRIVEAEVDKDTEYQSLLAWCKMNGYSFPPAKVSAWSRKLGLECDARGVHWTKVKDCLYGQKSIFPIWIIHETFEKLGPKVEE